MHKPIDISVVIPCFNHGLYIREAVESVLNQSIPVKEIIIIDDGSTDAQTIEILKKLELPKVKVYFNKNSGVSAARNFGFSLAKSEYVLTVDSDDYFHPSFLEKALNIIIKNKKLGAVSSWAQCFGNSKDIIHFKNSNLFDFLIKNQAVNAALIRKEAWQISNGYDESMLEGLEDWDFWIRILKNGFHIEQISEPLFYYRIKQNSRNQSALQKHDRLYKELLIKHKDIFIQFYPDVFIYLKNHMENIVQGHLNSKTYKLGKILLNPFKQIKEIIFKTR